MRPLAKIRAERIARDAELERLRAANRRAWRRLRIGFGVPALLLILWIIWYAGYLTGTLNVS